jgi:hypothetical protein
MDEIGINVLVEAKLEYTKQLISLLSPRIYGLLKEIYISNCSEDKKYELKNFQLALSEIPSWDQFKIQELTEKILEKVKCEWIDELLTAVFVSNTRILTAVQMRKSNKKLKLEVPKFSIFIHKCFIECARELYKNPYLMLYDDKPEIIHQNMRETFNIIKESINETIRKLLPFKEILKKYLGNPEDSFDDSASIISEPLVLKPSNKMMRKLLGDEIDEESVYSFTANEKNIEEDFAEENISVQSSTDTIEEKGEDKTNDILEDSYETETLNDFQFSDENIKESSLNRDDKVEELVNIESIEEQINTQKEEEQVNTEKEEQELVNTEKEEQELVNTEKEEQELVNTEKEEQELVNEEKTIVLKSENKVELTQENIENLGLNIEENKKVKIIENLELESKNEEANLETNELESNKIESNELKLKNEDLFEIDTFINKSKNKNSKDSIIIPVKRKVVKRKKLNYKNKFLTPDRLTVSNENIKRESSFEDELKNNILFSDLQDERENEL